jgi:hypothetical protein
MATALRASLGKVLAFRATAHHLTARLPRADWAGALDVGLQDTPPGSGPLALAARVEGVDAGTWEAERVAARHLVVSWSLRGAPFGHRAGDHDLFSVAALPTDERSWLTLLSWTRKMPAEIGMGPGDAVALVAGEVESLLSESPMTKADLSTALRKRLPERLLPWCRGCKVHHVHEQVLRTAALFGGFVFGEDAGDRFTLVRADEWLAVRRRAGSASSWAWPQPAAARAATLRLGILRRYLAWYGPADAAMFAGWLGVSTADGTRRMAEAEEAGALAPVSITGGRATTWLHVDDVGRFRAIRASDARGVRLIPTSDPYLQQRDREVLVEDPRRQKQVWTVLGSPGVVVVDGTAGGTWRAQKKGARLTIRVTPFEPMRPADIRGIEAEAEHVARARGTDLAGVTVAG